MVSSYVALVLALACRCAAEADSPVAKVVVLITEMKATCEKEADADQDAYDKYQCWSITNEKEKKAALKANKDNVADRTAFVNEAAGTSAQLSTEIKGLAKDLEEDTAALASASEQREKESQEFQASEADMKETIGLLDKATQMLGAVQLLQKKGQDISIEEQETTLLQVHAVAKRVQRHPQFGNMIQKDLFDVLGSLEQVAAKATHKRGGSLAGGALLSDVFMGKHDVSSLFQNLLKDDAKPNNLKGAAAGAKAYNPRSSAILGILKEMQDEFKRDLASAQKEDFTALVNFQKLNAAKTSEINAATEQKEMKEGQLADLQDKVAAAKESIEASNDAIDQDSKFLKNLLASRKKEEEEFNTRTKTRSDEVKALGETLAILTDDDARALFGKTVSFLQVSTAARERMQNKASKRAMQRLMDVGRKHQNMALMAMAVRVRLDAFTKVHKAIDKMSAALKVQQAEEYKKNEQCKKEIDQTEDKIWVAKETQSDLGEKHTDLVNQLSELGASIATVKGEVAESEVSMKKAGEQRKSENMIFQKALEDQKATVKILNMALGKLKAFYASKSSFLQQPRTNDYSKSGASGGVMQLLNKIITDAEVESQQLTMSETDAQQSYAQFVQDTTKSIEGARKAIGQKLKHTAGAKSEKSETEASQIANSGELKTLNKLLTATHGECDFLLKFFDVRQKARSEEMDAIAEAKAILSGAK